MQDLLFLAHRIPFPPDKGDKIRSWHLLRHLAQRYRVHLGAFIDTPEDRRHVPILQVICASTHFEILDPRAARLRAAKGMFRGEALSFPYYRHAGMREWVQSVASAHAPRIGLAFSAQVAPYLMDVPGNDMRRIVDFVDVDSEKWNQYGNSQPFPRSWIYRREARLLAAAEAELAAAADASIFVSEAEAALFRERTGLGPEKVKSVGNGVDLQTFDPACPIGNPYDRTGRTPVIVFAGAMDYWANVDAVCWFVSDVMPMVRQAFPEARFVIAGANPAPAVLALGREPGVTVTGRVRDIRGYVRYADVSVAPLRIARGVQNKVLEAMALARPVVCTPQALEGIDATTGRDLRVGGDAPALAREVLAVLRDPAAANRMGEQARRRVVECYSWPAQVRAIDAILDGDAHPEGASVEDAVAADFRQAGSVA